MAQARQPEVALAQAWQECGENPTDSSAWEKLFRLLLPVIGGIISRTFQRWRVHERAEIDDLLQDVSVKIWELSRTRRRLPVEDAKLKAYFRKMAANAAVTWIRRRHTRRRNADASVPFDDRLPLLAERLGLQNVERKILIRQVEKHLKCPQRDHNVFRLYFRQGLTAAEIAAIPAVGLSVEGVESLLHRLTVDLRERMRKPR